ncbi:hypothetical protein HPS57_12935 [Prevotella sp. PINT]|jgi:hypothetical protein|uniref:hypothetical protein n=1 Tax=Palleniella intestinalis TaxID=2736291 RepID=UPI00155365E8|nr:hypothetical protein [Palleniella intestinalis]NPD82874.1 hypothetical protein [Palleniella intestinalis]
MNNSIFDSLNKRELDLVKAGEAGVTSVVQGLAASGHGYALKCCSDNQVPDTVVVQKPVDKPIQSEG